jgi:hypothetical protein
VDVLAGVRGTDEETAMGHIFWNERIKLIYSGEMVDVLAIGDSWFHYPFNNLMTPLYEALARPTIYVIGESGARADELSTGSWLASFGAMLAELYPTAIRGSGQGFVYNIGRGLSALAPFVVGALGDRHGLGAALGLNAGFFLLGAGIVFLLPETMNVELTSDQLDAT